MLHVQELFCLLSKCACLSSAILCQYSPTSTYNKEDNKTLIMTPNLDIPISLSVHAQLPNEQVKTHLIVPNGGNS